jgi:hypothetical protein
MEWFNKMGVKETVMAQSVMKNASVSATLSALENENEEAKKSDKDKNK